MGFQGSILSRKYDITFFLHLLGVWLSWNWSSHTNMLHIPYSVESCAYRCWFPALKCSELVPLVVMMWYRYLPATAYPNRSYVVVFLSERSTLPCLQLPSGNRLPSGWVFDSWFNYWLSVGCAVCVLVNVSYCACKRDRDRGLWNVPVSLARWVTTLWFLPNSVMGIEAL